MIIRNKVLSGLLFQIIFVLLTLIAGCQKKNDPAGPSASQTESGLKARMERLKYGFNVDDMRSSLAPPGLTELQRLKSTGFRHIRLVVGVSQLFNENSPGVIAPAALGAVRIAVQGALDAGLAVVIDMHDAEDRLWEDAAYGFKYALFWQTLAATLSSYDPEFVFFEVANEPVASHAVNWNSNHRKICEAIREGAPRHTIIADANLRTSPDAWDQIGSLVQLEVLPDTNIVYSFHFYEPMNFTHQGATWGSDHWQYLHEIPYPSSPGNITAAVAASDPSVKSSIEYYGAEQWNSEKILSRFAVAGQWAEEQGVPVYCGELGCIDWTDAPPGSREAWYRDVKAAVDQWDMGWAIWFGYGEEVLNGLGMN